MSTRWRRVLRAVPAAAVALALGACGWEPLSRPPTRRQILTGPAHIDAALDQEGEFLLIARSATWSIVQWRKEGRACHLPVATTVAYGPLRQGPPQDAEAPAFLLPILLQQGEDQRLHFADERCQLRGPFGSAPKGISVFGAGERQLALYFDTERALHLVDPWASHDHVVAPDVDSFAVSSMTPALGASREIIWTLERGRLVQRALGGEALVTLGEAVTEFVHAPDLVAFVDDGVLYQARGPDFEPTMIMPDACKPRYDLGRETTLAPDLEFVTPCRDGQLFRRRFWGELLVFEPGVYRVVDVGGLLLEYARSAAGEEQMFVSWPQGTREERPFIVQEVMEALQLGPTQHVALATDGSAPEAGQMLGSWDAANASFTPALPRVERLLPALAEASSASVALPVYHDVHDGLGTISLVLRGSGQAVANPDGTRPPFGLVTAAMGVPSAGYAQGWAVAERFSPQPIAVIAVLEAAQPAPGTRSGFRGRLRVDTPFVVDDADGEPGPKPLSEVVAEGVGSFHLVTSPSPGAVYGVEEGPGAGLWFSEL